MLPTRRTLATAATVALLSTAGLAACSEEEPVDEGGTTAEEQTGDATATTGTAAPEDDASATTAPVEDRTLSPEDKIFQITVPEGWQEVTAEAREGYDEDEADQILLAARETERQDDFFTNVVVTQEEYVGNLTSAVEDTAEELADADGDYELLDPAPVDGNLAPGYTLVREVNDTTIHQTQRWISNQGTLYVVTFSAVDTQAEAAAPVLDEILDSWRWQG